MKSWFGLIAVTLLLGSITTYAQDAAKPAEAPKTEAPKAAEAPKTEPTAAGVQAEREQVPPTTKSLDEKMDKDLAYGNPDAKVKVVEYASLSCPHCKDFYLDVFTKIKPDYIDTGKVYFVYRHFPLNLPALRAAQIVDCIPETERKYAFMNAFFKAQGDWAYVSDEKTLLEKLKTITKVGGMDDKDFDACINDKKEETGILERQLRASKELEIKSTPSLFVNGKKFLGNHNLEVFKKTLDDLLAASPKS